MHEIPERFFDTSRLRFRPFVAGDLDALHEMHNDPAVYRYVGDSTPLSRQDAERWIVTSRKNIARFGFGSGAIVLRATGELIGWGGFSRPDGEPPEIIYGFAATHWGQGYGSEIIAVLIPFASQFEEIRTAGELRATVDPANAVSIHLLEKHGFRLKEKTYEGDENSDLYALSLT